MSDKLSKPSAGNSVTKSFKLGYAKPKILQAVEQAAVAAQQRSELAGTLPNRIALLVDDSGSMNGSANAKSDPYKSKIDFLHEAAVGFVNAVNFSDTSLVVHGFNENSVPPLSCDSALLTLACESVRATGSTPIGETLQRVLENVSLTRAVLISDGEATDFVSDETLGVYRELGIPVDCVHIGDSHEGEALLAHIAELTKGMFVKFSDVASFARSLKYLTPKLRGLLASKSASEVRQLLGSDEVRK